MSDGVDFMGLEYIALHLRECDAREVHGIRWDDDPMMLAMQSASLLADGHGRVVYYRGRPAAVIGVVELHPGVWQGWAYGTEDFARVVPRLTRLVRNELRAYVVNKGGHRLEVFSRFDHWAAHRWLERLGAVREGLMRGFGKDGADYVRFAWTKGKD